MSKEYKRHVILPFYSLLELKTIEIKIIANAYGGYWHAWCQNLHPHGLK